MTYRTPQPAITDYAVAGTIPAPMLAALLGFADAVMAQRPPDFTAGDSYLERWRLAEYGDGSNAYLHRFSGDDDDGAAHDHPYDNVSTILRTGYYEHMHKAPLHVVGGKYDMHTFWRAPGSVISRKATVCHRLSLARPEDGSAPPCDLSLHPRAPVPGVGVPLRLRVRPLQGIPQGQRRKEGVRGMSDQEHENLREKRRTESKKTHEDVLAVLQRLTTVTTVEGFLECVRLGAGIAMEQQKREIAERFGP